MRRCWVGGKPAALHSRELAMIALACDA